MRRGGWGAAVGVAAWLACGAVPAVAAPAEEVIVPLEKYSSAKGRALGEAYGSELRRLYEQIYHCIPWVDQRTLGFNRPRFAVEDDRYISLWVWVEQDEDRQFAALPVERRASAMLSRYGVPLLRRLAAVRGLSTEPNLDGFGVILSWVKPGTLNRPGVRPVNETLAFFIDRASGLAYLGQKLPAAEFAARARHTLFDGEQSLGRVALEVWPDPFLDTFRLKDYTPPQGVSC